MATLFKNKALSPFWDRAFFGSYEIGLQAFIFPATLAFIDRFVLRSHLGLDN